jgi:hypothetical protein
MKKKFLFIRACDKYHQLDGSLGRIWASATHKGLTLITRNTKDFKASSPGIRIPYSLR